MLENLDKIMHLGFNCDACLKHSPFGFVHLTHQNLSAHALFCHNSLAKVNAQLLIYKYSNLFQKNPFAKSHTPISPGIITFVLMFAGNQREQRIEKGRGLLQKCMYRTMFNHICDMIKGNESDVVHIDIEIQA